MIKVPMALVLAAGVAAALQIGKGIIALPAVQAEQGLSLPEVTALLSTFAVFGACVAMPWGVSVGRFGARRSLLLGLALIAIGNVVGSVSQSFATLLVGRVIEGAGFLSIVTAAPILLGRMSTHDNRSQVFAVWGAYMPLGMGLMLLAGMVLDLAHWRLLWTINAALAAALFLLCLAFVPRDPPRGRDAGALAVGPMLREFAADRRPLLMTASFFLYASLYFAVVGLLPTFLMTELGMSATLVAPLAAGVVFANMLGNLGAGVLFARGFGLAQVMASAFALGSALAAATFFFGATPTQAIVLAVAAMLTAGAVPATVMASAPLIARRIDHVGAMMGLFTQGSTFGQFIGPLLFATAVEAFGWARAGLGLALFGALGVICVLTVRRTGPGLARRPAEEPAE